MQGGKQKHGLDRADRLLPDISKLELAAEAIDAQLESFSQKRYPIRLDAFSM